MALGGLKPGLYAIVHEYFLYLTQDSGKSWHDLSLRVPGTDSIKGVGVDPLHPSRILLNLEGPNHAPIDSGNSAIVSTDGGQSWKLIGKGLSFLAFDPIHTNIVYFIKSDDSGNTRLYKSTEGGFNPAPTGANFSYEYPTQALVDENDGRILYFVMYQGVYKTADGGRTLRRADHGIVADSEGSTASWIAPLSTRDSYIAVTWFGNVYRTSDGGEHWERVSHVPIRVHGGETGGAKIFSADVLGRHFFAIDDAGVLESRDGARSWSNITKQFGADPLPLEFINMTDPRHHPFYFSSYSGIFAEILP